MNCRLISVAVLHLTLLLGSSAFAGLDTAACPPPETPEVFKCSPDSAAPLQSTGGLMTPAVKSGNLPIPAEHPKVVFQINQAADAPSVLRYVANYLIVEPGAEVAVVGYAGGVDFMLQGAKDPEGKPYAKQIQALADKGVFFKACGNTLKGRSLAADLVVSQASVVPSAVNEIIRLQTRQGYAYFRH